MFPVSMSAATTAAVQRLGNGPYGGPDPSRGREA